MYILYHYRLYDQLPLSWLCSIVCNETKQKLQAHVLTMYRDVRAMYEHVITPSHPPKHLFLKEYSEGRKKLKNVGTEIMSIQTKVIKL